MHAPDLSLYLHIPFCDHRCAYCDFNAYAGLDELIPAYVDALAREIDLWSEAVSKCEVTTVFLGGGTPSLLEPRQVGKLMDAMNRGYRLAPSLEVTMEVNPGTVDEEKLRGFRSAGVTRLSLGAQSFDDDELRRLDRIHSVAAVRDAVAMARSAGFDNVNLDLIYGLPYGSFESWRRTLEAAIELSPEHLSLYALTVEEGTPLAQQVQGGLERAPDPDAAAQEYEWARARLPAAGYEQYEISNWARPDRACRHNLTYWDNEAYIGMGAGAHSWWRGARFEVIRSPRRYIEAMRSASAGAFRDEGDVALLPQVAWAERIDRRTEMAEMMMLGLRKAAGVSSASFRHRFGLSPEEAFGEALDECRSLGLLSECDDAYRLTPRGQLLASEVVLRILASTPLS